MANLVNIEAVSKAYGIRTLLDGVSLGIAEGDRIGVVGRNGDGKSTLLKLITGAEEPDAGAVTRVGGLQLALIGQGDAPALAARQRRDRRVQPLREARQADAAEQPVQHGAKARVGGPLVLCHTRE